MMKWAFIDYENIGSLAKINLSAYEKVIVFMGANQPRLNFSDKKYDGPIDLAIVQIKDMQPNNLDFHLAYYLGKLDSEADKDVVFEVITNDFGFTPLIAHVKKSGRLCRQVKIGEWEESVQKLVSSITTRPVEERPQRVNSLRNYIASHLALKGNEEAIRSHINHLVTAEIITISDSTLEYLC